MQVAEIDPKLYNQFLATSDDYFHQQTPASAQANRTNGRDVELVALWEGEEVLAVAKLTYLRYKKIFRAVELYFGPIFDTQNPEVFEQFVQELIRYVKRDVRNIRLRLVPLIAEARISNEGEKTPNELSGQYLQILKEAGFEQLIANYDEEAGIQAKFFYVKEFDEMTEEEVRSSFTSSCRGHMRKAERFGVQVRFLGADEYQLFNDILSETMARTGMPAYTANRLTKADFEAFGKDMLLPLAYIDRNHSLATLQKEIDEFNQEIKTLSDGNESRRTKNQIKQARDGISAAERRINQVNEFCDEHGDIVNLAVSQFFFSKSDCSYYQSGAIEEGFIFSPVYAIHDLMFKLAFDRGVKRYNMFAVSNPSDDDTNDGGVMKFKETFNGEYIEFLGTFERKLRLCFLQ